MAKSPIVVQAYSSGEFCIDGVSFLHYNSSDLCKSVDSWRWVDARFFTARFISKVFGGEHSIRKCFYKNIFILKKPRVSNTDLVLNAVYRMLLQHEKSVIIIDSNIVDSKAISQENLYLDHVLSFDGICVISDRSCVELSDTPFY